jgi:ribosomal protein L21E
MNYYRDYKLMISDRYIHDKGVYGDVINSLQDQLKNTKSIWEALTLMTHIDIYKRVMSIQVTFQPVKDQKNPDNVYIHARGSVMIGKGAQRYWIGEYIGKRGEVTEAQKRHAVVKVMDKAVEKLKEIEL